MTPANPHLFEYRVIYGDTDAGGVVYYANYLRFFEMGRTELMRSAQVPYRLIEEQGLLMPVTECHVRYRAPVRYDDLIRIETRISKLTRYSCRFDYRIISVTGNKALTEGFTKHAAVDRHGKLRPLPNQILENMAPLFDVTG